MKTHNGITSKVCEQWHHQHSTHEHKGVALTLKDVWHDLAAVFKEKANQTTIFPKLPSMLRAHYTKWKSTQELVQMKDAMRVDYYGLLKRMQDHSNTKSNQPQDFQKEASDNDRGEQLLEAIEEEEDTGMPIPDNVELSDDAMGVAPLAAPEQREYEVSGDGRKPSNRRCAGAAFGCDRLAVHCSWNKWQNCKKLKAGSKGMTIPRDEEHAKELRAAHNHRRSSGHQQKCRDKDE